MNILQVNKADSRCGAMRTAWGLHHAHLKQGHQARIAVGTKSTDFPEVIQLDNEPRGIPGRLIRRVRQTLFRQLGIEDFSYPGIRRLINTIPGSPDIFHAHNLHDHFFDLRILPELCRRMTVVLSLHDAWLLSGHCAHSFGCERWKIGCGHCPDLAIYPPLRRDGTAHNWQTRQRIFKDCRLCVTTPSQWLMDKVQASILAPAIVEARVIPNGVDTSVFQPGDKKAARTAMGLPLDAVVALFTAKAIRSNPWKDFSTLRRALELIASRRPSPALTLVALGDDGAGEKLGNVTIRFVPFESDPATVARYYQAADIYLHTARIDTFPYAILEAMACGLPVVTSAVGGIPEQIRDGETGFLVPQGDATAVAERTITLMEEKPLRDCMGQTALRKACEKFELSRQTAAYQEWFERLCAKPADYHI